VLPTMLSYIAIRILLTRMLLAHTIFPAQAPATCTASTEVTGTSRRSAALACIAPCVMLLPITLPDTKLPTAPSSPATAQQQPCTCGMHMHVGSRAPAAGAHPARCCTALHGAHGEPLGQTAVLINYLQSAPGKWVSMHACKASPCAASATWLDA
jgi:hypothetical protein